MKKLIIVFCMLFMMAGCAVTDVQRVSEPEEHIVTIDVMSGSDVDLYAFEEEAWDFDEALPPQFGEGELKPANTVAMVIPGDKAFIKLYSSLSVADTIRFEQTLVFLEERTNIRDIVVLMNTGGGSAFDGLAMADMIREYRAKGFKITTKARGIVASAAVPIFAMGDPRIAAQGCIFMVHEASLWKWPGKETASDIRAQGRLMDLLRSRYIGILVERSETPKEVWERMEGTTTWFSTEQAIELGICDESI